jgi:precorrin-2 dehydrogenase/sirohydrochlorin ferrochelatase
MSEPKQYPKVQGGGSLILAWQVRNKPVLVIGGGAVSPVPPPALFCPSPWR